MGDQAGMAGLEAGAGEHVAVRRQIRGLWSRRLRSDAVAQSPRGLDIVRTSIAVQIGCGLGVGFRGWAASFVVQSHRCVAGLGRRVHWGCHWRGEDGCRCFDAGRAGGMVGTEVVGNGDESAEGEVGGDVAQADDAHLCAGGRGSTAEDDGGYGEADGDGGLEESRKTQ